MAADDAVPAQVEPAIEAALRDVYDPCCRDRGVSVVDMGLLHRAEVRDGVARVELLLTSGWCPFASRVLGEVETAVRGVPGVADASVEVVWDEAWGPHRLSDSARTKLRFLPDPTAVRDPKAYVDEHWPTAARRQRGGNP
jgi:metal-sulfur cluster biosynthetic enzyme